MKKYIIGLLATILVTSCTSKTSTSNEETNNKTNNNETNKIDPNNFSGIVKAETLTLDASITYNLTGSLVVEEGGKLIIPAGTTIKASGGTSAYIAIAQGGKIEINGTKNKPVIMTSANDAPKAGDWGGLVVCGKAPTNKGGEATSEVASLSYGGTQSDDNSGIIRYLRIEYSGANFNATKEFNGLSLFGVGSGTTLEYIESYKSSDDGIEFFGGTVNAKYMVAIGNEDDSLDFADGWQGTGNYWYIKDVVKAGIEGSNNGDNGNATPKTTATLKNISIVRGTGTATEHALYIKEGGGSWRASNIYVHGFDKGIKIKGADKDRFANENVTNGDITFNPIQFVETPTKSEYTGTNTTYITEGDNNGAGAGKELPTWAEGWTRQ